MPKCCSLAHVSFLCLAWLATGCKRDAPSDPPEVVRPAYFQTPFQDESQFIVESVTADIAEQLYYAAHHALPSGESIRATATEERQASSEAPTYNVRLRLDQKAPELTIQLKFPGSIWSAAAYEGLTSKVALSLGLRADPTPSTNAITSLLELADNLPETIERKDQELSAALDQNFRTPDLHERAALLLGMFAFRDHSGHFLDIRPPLCRITSHLAIAHWLTDAELHLDGQLAEATLLTLINSETAAVKQLDLVEAKAPEALPLIRALRCRATGDYRAIAELTNATPIERAEYFCSRAGYAGSATAWLTLSEKEKQTIDFVRIANQQRYSVEMGHELVQRALPLEMAEISRVYELTRWEKLGNSGLVKALNEVPGSFLRVASTGSAHVQVIGWNQWAWFLQRHLCHAIQQNYYFVANMLGDTETGSQFAAQSEREFGRLSLYPFVRRFNCSTVQEYHDSLDEGFQVTKLTPQWVPGECWDYLGFKVRFAPLYLPVTNPHLNQWFRHDPPAGTAYDLVSRLRHHALWDDPEAVERLEKLHQLAPYDGRIAAALVKRKYNDHPTYAQAVELFDAELPYSVYAMKTVAGTLKDQPEQYEKLMTQAAAIDPGCYYTLGDYFIHREEEEKAAKYIEQGCHADPDAVRVASYAVWRVQHCFRTHQIDKAGEIAEEAAEVYSERGLEAKAIFLEGTTNFDGAFEWFSKIEERYDDVVPLIGFCFRYEAQTGDGRFAPEVKKRSSKLFPNGFEKVSLTTLHNPPPDGVVVRRENELIRQAGLKAGDIIVAVYGTRIHNLLQYLYARETGNIPELDLIVWQGNSYRQFKPNPPNHRFGVEFDNYVLANGDPQGLR